MSGSFPAAERIAVVGPLVTVVLAGGFIGIAVLWQFVRHVAEVRSAGPSDPSNVVPLRRPVPAPPDDRTPSKAA